jgi:integrase
LCKAAAVGCVYTKKAVRSTTFPVIIVSINVHDYIDAAGIRQDGKTPLFRSAAGRTDKLTDKPMHRVDAYLMIQRRAAELGMRVKIGCHTFRATGITAYLEGGGTLEKAQTMAGHESPRTTKLYDRTADEITLDEVERITI